MDNTINSRVKKEQSIDNILKPDNSDYNPFVLLDYDIENHTYLPQILELDYQLLERIEKMINVLGINTCVSKRAAYLKSQFLKIFLEEDDWNNIKPTQFPTAFEFCKRKCLVGKVDLADLIDLY